jgi:hypothetical protein
MDDEVITVHEVTELVADTPTFPKGKIARFTCSKCKGETTSVVVDEDDIKNYNSPMLRYIKDKQEKIHSNKE